MWSVGDQVAFRSTYNQSGWYTSRDWRNGRIIALNNQGRTATVIVRADKRSKESKDAVWDVPTRCLKAQREPDDLPPVRTMSVDDWMAGK